MGQGQRSRYDDTSAGVSIDRTLAALADPYRRRCVELLGQQPRRAGELAQLLDLSAPSMSRHLRTLREADIVEEVSPTFDARVRVYSLKAQSMADLKLWLDTAEAMWVDQLGAFKRHVEAR